MATTVSELSSPPRRRSSGGWRVIASKELTDHLISVRFFILIAIMGLSAIAAVYSAAGGIREASSAIDSDFPGLFLKLFTVQPEASRIPPFFALVALLGPLFGIAFGFDAVNGERSQGTLPRLLSQPIHRDDVINGKFVAGLSVIGIVLVSLSMIVAGVGIIRIGVTPSLSELVRLVGFLVVSIVYIGFWLALSSLFSVVLRKASTSALAAIAAWLVASLFALLLVGIVADIVSPLPENPTLDEAIANAKIQRNLSFIFPQSLYQEATVALLEPEQRTFNILGLLSLQDPSSGAIRGPLSLEQSLSIVWPQVTGLIALTVLCFAGAYVAFMSQEVRA